MKKIFITLVLLIILFVGFFSWYQTSLQPVNTSDKSTKIFVIQKGENIRTVASKLEQQGLIKNAVVFFIIVKQKGIEGKIQAGDFRLSPSESAEKIADDLTHGVLDIWVTILEGKRAEEIVDILKDKLPSYNDLWKQTLISREGYLFPDTYLIPVSANLDFVSGMFQKNFNDHFTDIQKNSQFTNEQIVTIASLVEREAKFASDRPLIASVITNRLKINMALQIDSTVQYALGYQNQTKTWWKKNLTIEALKYPSPYNTYLNPGLPPSPICNPGQAALEAAAHPADTQYLYYIADKSGHSHFAKTLDEHNANIKKYGL